MSRVRRFVRITVVPLIIGAAALVGVGLSAGGSSVPAESAQVASAVALDDSSWA